MSRMRSGHGGRRVRRQFSEEFKEGAVRLVLDEGKTVSAVARELDLTASALSLWVRHERAERTQGKTGLTKEEREELARLRKENRELRMERDILRKAIDPRAAERIARECRRNLSPAGAFWGRQAELALLNHLWSEAKLPDAGQLVVSRVTGSMLDAAQSWPED